jgi:hypothetical protein
VDIPTPPTHGVWVGDSPWSHIIPVQTSMELEVFSRLQGATAAQTRPGVSPAHAIGEEAIQALIGARRAMTQMLLADPDTTCMTLCRLPMLQTLNGSLEDTKMRNVLFELFKAHRDALMPLSSDDMDSDNFDRLEHLYYCSCSDHINGVQALVIKTSCMYVMALSALQAIRGIRSDRQHFAFMAEPVEPLNIAEAYWTSPIPTVLTGAARGREREPINLMDDDNLEHQALTAGSTGQGRSGRSDNVSEESILSYVGQDSTIPFDTSKIVLVVD